jgi:hypothetical protein
MAVIRWNDNELDDNPYRSLAESEELRWGRFTSDKTGVCEGHQDGILRRNVADLDHFKNQKQWQAANNSVDALTSSSNTLSPRMTG